MSPSRMIRYPVNDYFHPGGMYSVDEILKSSLLPNSGLVSIKSLKRCNNFRVNLFFSSTDREYWHKPRWCRSHFCQSIYVIGQCIKVPSFVYCLILTSYITAWSSQVGFWVMVFGRQRLDSPQLLKHPVLEFDLHERIIKAHPMKNK